MIREGGAEKKLLFHIWLLERLRKEGKRLTTRERREGMKPKKEKT